MTRRRLLLAAAVLAGALSAVLYLVSAQRAPVVVMARDLEASQPLAADDLATLSLPLDAIPAGAIGEARAAVGRYLRAPLTTGQLVLSGALADDAALFASGLRPPAGMRAIAVPVTVAHALGGALAPGVRVDVIAVPIAGKAPASRPIELVASRAVVLDVRGESGIALGRPPARGGALERLGSIVIAIAPSDELRLAERIATSTFVVALAPR
jgi:Flp pilus assembly protein CpaB